MAWPLLAVLGIWIAAVLRESENMHSTKKDSNRHFEERFHLRNLKAASRQECRVARVHSSSSSTPRRRYGSTRVATATGRDRIHAEGCLRQTCGADLTVLLVRLLLVSVVVC